MDPDLHCGDEFSSVISVLGGIGVKQCWQMVDLDIARFRKMVAFSRLNRVFMA